MTNKDIKKVGCELKQNVWEAINLVKMNTKISIKEMINELIIQYLSAYAQVKHVPNDLQALIEEKLKAVKE